MKGAASFTKTKALFLQVLLSLHNFLTINFYLAQSQKDIFGTFNDYRVLPIMCLQPNTSSTHQSKQYNI